MLKNKELEISLLTLAVRHLKGLVGAVEKYLEAIKKEETDAKTG